MHSEGESPSGELPHAAEKKSRMRVLSVGEELAAAPPPRRRPFSEGGSNSPNAGPCGDAIINELITAVENALASVDNLSHGNKIAYSTMVANATKITSSMTILLDSRFGPH